MTDGNDEGESWFWVKTEELIVIVVEDVDDGDHDDNDSAADDDDGDSRFWVETKSRVEM